MNDNQKTTQLIYNGSFGQPFSIVNEDGTIGEDVAGKFSYSFNFILSEPIDYFIESMPLPESQKFTKVNELLKHIFTEELKKYLEQFKLEQNDSN